MCASQILPAEVEPLQIDQFDVPGCGGLGPEVAGESGAAEQQQPDRAVLAEQPAQATEPVELIAADGLLIPRLMGLAATCLVALMVGAVILTAVFVGGALVAIPATVGVLVAIVAWARRRSTAELVALVRR